MPSPCHAMWCNWLVSPWQCTAESYSQYSQIHHESQYFTSGGLYDTRCLCDKKINRVNYIITWFDKYDVAFSTTSQLNHDTQSITPPIQCVAVCCSVLQCVAVCCSVLQCASVHSQLHHDTQSITPSGLYNTVSRKITWIQSTILLHHMTWHSVYS